MDMQLQSFKCKRKLCLAALLLLICIVPLLAQTGNIDTSDKWAWGTNIGWVDFHPQYGGVTVYSDHLEGYAWAENIGWIRMGTHTGGSPHTYENTESFNYGVNLDESGNFSGHAWSSSAGWIRFDTDESQVTIDFSTGSFDGYAWGENIGWIHFKNASPAYNVVCTDTALPVTLSSFTAAYQNNASNLSWTTQSETSNLGWNLYRGDSEDVTVSTILNENIIPGAGNTSQITQYSWQDADELAAGAAYWYWLESVSYSGVTETFGPVTLTIPYEEPGQNNPEVPQVYGLMQNHPNPFNPCTEISFVLPSSAHCTIDVYSISGRKVITLIDEVVAANEIKSVIWQGDDAQGKPVASGIYFYKMRAGKYTSTKKMILMK
jgi:hypothetical protein